MAELTPSMWVLACLVAFAGGLIKGMVGFALPMIMMAGLGLFLAPDVALAALIVPALISNGAQAAAGGVRAAWQCVVSFRVFMLAGAGALMLSAQAVTLVSGSLLLVFLGVVVSGFALLAIAGARGGVVAFSGGLGRGGEVLCGAFSGAIGGMSGIWGPPTVLYLTAMDTPKDRQIQAQGVIYAMAAILMLGSHLASGVLDRATLPLSVALVVPTGLGMVLGWRWCARVDQVRFRQATLRVLLLTGLVLLGRGLWSAF